jgi:3-hydroxyacyl-CoA dehydrogenase
MQMTTTNHGMREAQTPAAVHMATARTEDTGYAGEMPANSAPRPIRRVGIIGAEAIGIAMRLLDADMPVTLFDSRRESTAQAVANARSAYDSLVGAGQLAADQRDRRMGLLTGAANFHHLKDCDLILATRPSEMPAAERLFRHLDELVGHSTILVSNHVPAQIAQLARSTRRPADVLGMRLSDAAGQAGLFEIVRARETSEEAFTTVDALLEKMRSESPAF